MPLRLTLSLCATSSNVSAHVADVHDPLAYGGNNASSQGAQRIVYYRLLPRVGVTKNIYTVCRLAT